ncbi:MAG: hypothetical protein OEO19_01960 [Gammaproteobacteria bacterium]|nr:hypothetical protein [Gammaproteobacteria bacterium]MDH3450214.1 hypothetical protein [Gammaproteobacteria bacterium]
MPNTESEVPQKSGPNPFRHHETLLNPHPDVHAGFPLVSAAIHPYHNQ